VGYAIRGFIWYQGESNRDDAMLYKRLFPAMVKDWRMQWGYGELPFYYVQIAPFGSALNEIPKSGMNMREVQLNSMLMIPNSGMAVTMDVGMEKYIHCMDKTKPAQRLAYLAFAKTYQLKGIGYSGPVFKEMKINGNKAVLRFDYADNGLTFYGKEPSLFEVAGSDKIFYPAKATINADGTLTISGDKVSVPVAVRYAFKNYVVGDFYNTDGLPASSFRTDNWDN
jgi:sialate O-acetylesterase